MTPAQCRAARGLLDCTQAQLSEWAEVSVVTVRQFENDLVQPRRASIAALRRALEKAGIEFLDSDGVCLRRDASPAPHR